MKSPILITTMLAMLIMLVVSGCSTAAPAAQPTVSSAPVATSTDVTAEGRLEPVRYIELSAASNGSITSILAAQGDEVQAGQVILQLQGPPAVKAPPPKCTLVPQLRHRLWNYRRPPFLTYASVCEPVLTEPADGATQTAQTLTAAQASAALRLADANQRMHDAQAQLDQFFIPAQFSGMTAPDGARQAWETLNAARAALEPYKDSTVQGYRVNHSYPWLPRSVYIDTEYYKTGLGKQLKKAVDNGWVDFRRTVTWLEMETALEKAQADAAQAQKDYDSLQDAAMSEDTAGSRAALATAEVRAPFAGTITNLDLKAGESVTPGKPVITLADFSSWVVNTTDLTEIDVVNIKEGQPVNLTLDAIPGLTLNGHVLSIAQNYTQRQGDIVYKVTVLLTDKSPQMRWGMTAKLHFGK